MSRLSAAQIVHDIPQKAGTLPEGAPVITTKAVVIWESMDSDGVRSLYWLTSDEMSNWDTLGMIETVQVVTQGRMQDYDRGGGR